MTDTAPKPSTASDHSILDLVLTFVVEQDPRGELGYAEQIERLDDDAANEVVATIGSPALQAELGAPRGQDNYLRLLRLIEPKLTSKSARNLAELLQGYPGELDGAVNDPRVRQLLVELS
jgi:hypothetical protein